MYNLEEKVGLEYCASFEVYKNPATDGGKEGKQNVGGMNKDDRCYREVSDDEVSAIGSTDIAEIHNWKLTAAR